MMIKEAAKLINGLRTLAGDPLFINAYVQIVQGSIEPANWGDDINYHFIKHLTKRNVSVYFDNPLAVRLKKVNYLCIGSTLNYLTTQNTIVWGAGVIDEALALRAIPASVHAVRGPLTREYLLARGIDCPAVYGDPALLLPYFYQPPRRQCGRRPKVCIIPHYADQDTSKLTKITGRRDLEVEVVDITKYGRWTDFVDRICDSDLVLSSSLHGLIVAESYGVPNHWIRFSDKVIGGGFKFRDFFKSIGKDIEEPIHVDGDLEPAEFISCPWTQGTLDLTKLLAACPFEIKEPVRYVHSMTPDRTRVFEATQDGAHKTVLG